MSQFQLGLVCALGAYCLWGVFPIYFRWIAHVGAVEVLAHRVIWSFVFLLGLITIVGGGKEVRRAVATRRVRETLMATTLLIAINWLVFVVAVTSGHVLQASLGYFITPLVNVLFGVALLGERLRPVQQVSLALASVGVLNMSLLGDSFPWMSLVLAVTFGAYGLLRKTVAADAMVGLFVETLFLTPIAAVYGVWLIATGTAGFTADANTCLLLLAAGPITAVPLLLFAAGARRMPLATLGFLQFTAPSLQFLLAVFAFGEPFGRTQAISFAFIWSAVLLFGWDAARRTAAPAKA